MAEKAEAMKSVETQRTDSRGLSSPTIWDKQSPEMRDFAARVYEGHQLLQKLGRAPRELPPFIRAHLRCIEEEEAKEAAEATEEKPSPMDEVSPEMEVAAPPSLDPLPPATKASTKLGAGPAKRHRCGECGKGFRKRYHLQRHLRVHSGEKPFRCNVCERSFAVKSNLTKHKWIHSGEKPFQCNVCERCFADKSNLIHHNKIHSGEKPYQCTVCERCFNRKSNLTKHNRIHSGEKPFQCIVCKRRFADKSNLIHHNKIHKPKKLLKCHAPGCNKAYIRRNHFANHVRTHGDEKPRNKTRTNK